MADLITKIILKGGTDASLQKAFATAGKYSDTYIDKLQKIGDVALKAFKVVATAAAAGAAASVKASIDYESAFAGVQKTVDETDTTKYADLSKGIRDLAKVTPATASEIAAVAEAAGQLGIKADDVLNFSKTMIDLGESTNLTSDEAASSIAKLFNVTGTSMSEVENFGSTLVALGNNAATTESDILAMATRIAGSGKQVGLTEQQILALSTSLSSVGIEAEMGGSAISTTMTQIDKDVALQSENLKVWAKTAGLSSKEFASAWSSDAYGTLQKVLSGMAKTKDEGGNLNVLLEDLGINGIRQGDMLKRLSSATGLMSDMTTLANSAWAENTALSTEANTRYATMASKLQILKNKFTDLGIEVGNKLMPYFEKFVDKLSNIDFDAVAEKIGSCIDWLAEHAKTIGLIASLIAGAFVGIKIAGFIKGIVSLIQIISGLVKAFGLVKVVLATLGGPVTIIIAAVAALAAGFIYLWNTSEGFRNFWIGLWNSIKSAAVAVGNWLKNFFTVTIPTAFNTFVAKCKTVGEAIKNFFTETIPDAFNSVVTFFQQLPGKIWTWLVGVGQKIAAWGASLWAKAKEIGANFVNSIVTFFQQLPYKIGYVIGFVIGKIALFGQKLLNFATVTVPQFIAGVVNWFAQLPGKIWTWLVNTWNKFVAWRNNMYAKAWEIGRSVINAIVNFFATLPGKVWTWLTNTISKVTAWGANMVAIGRQKVSEFVSAAVTFIAQLPGRIWTWLVNAAQKVVTWGTQLAAKGLAAAQLLLTTIVNKVSEIPGQMLSIGTNIVHGIWNGISSAAGWLASKVSEFCSGIVGGIKKAMGINSPSVVMQKLFKWVPVGAGQGILNNAKYAVNAVKSMGSDITSAASKISPTIGGVSAKLPKYGTGGTVTSPQTAIVGDKPETIVPHGNTPRNRSLLAEAARGVGVGGGGGNTFHFTFAPVIQGGNANENRAMIRDEEEEFERRMNAWIAKNRRLAF